MAHQITLWAAEVNWMGPLTHQKTFPILGKIWESHLLVGQPTMYLVLLESCFKLQENGVYFMLLSWILFELSKFQYRNIFLCQGMTHGFENGPIISPVHGPVGPSSSLTIWSSVTFSADRKITSLVACWLSSHESWYTVAFSPTLNSSKWWFYSI